MRRDDFTQQQAADLAAQLILSDCLDALRAIPDSSVDSIVTDPPYGLKFMGAKWDYDVPSVELWAECLRVLKPGGYLLAFAGTRTQHRMACRIEDTGFEIRDMIAWVYGQGFPKHQSALKPALEPITLARKPAPRATLLRIDDCRVGTEAAGWDGSGKGRRRGTWNEGTCGLTGGRAPRPTVGRYPANLVHDGSPEVLALFPDSDGCGGSVPQTKVAGYGATAEYLGGPRTPFESGSGSAARFFYCAKASKRDRGAGNGHPTVKPTALMRYLCRLVTPPGGTVLDPFMGSGSTGKAAVLEGFQFIGIEREPEYFAIAQRRVHEPDSEEEQDRHANKGQITLFANEEQGDAA